MRRRTLSSGRGARGIAEIVGTLMLILIVIAAAIALAAFVASYEKQYLAEEAQSQQRSLENLKILSLSPDLNQTNSSRWGSFSFVLASEYINPSGIDSITLNGLPLRVYWVTNLSGPSGPPTAYSSSNPLILGPRQEVDIDVNLSANPTAPMGDAYLWFSVYDDSFFLTTTDYIELSVYTALQNTFSQVFIPPTAIAVVSTLTTLNDGNYETVPVLDGSNSFQPGNGTVVAWNWDVGNTSALISTSASVSNPTVSQASSPVAETGTADFDAPAGFITGTGVALAVTYTVTSGTEQAGTGITPGSLAILSQAVAGGVITVNYGFTYTVTGTGNSGTISIAATGAYLNYTTTITSGTLVSYSNDLVNDAVSQADSPVPVTGTAKFTAPPGFVTGTDLTLSVTYTGTGSGSITPGSLEITSQPNSDGTVTVSYAFTYTVTGEGDGGTIATTMTGASLSYTTLVLQSFSGEKVEPAYWMFAAPNTEFFVNLTVVNSDGLFGTTQIRYISP